MKKTRLALALALSLTFSAGIAQAQTASKPYFDEQVYNQIDTNKDGKISREEYRVFMEDAFNKLTPARTAS